MFLKKIICTFGMISFSMASYADLIISNNTDYYSVNILPNSGLCSGKYGKFSIADPNETLVVHTQFLQSLCSNQSPCLADIILSQNYSDALICKGTQMAKISVNLINGAVSIISMNDPNYALSISSNIISISRA